MPTWYVRVFCGNRSGTRSISPREHPHCRDGACYTTSHRVTGNPQIPGKSRSIFVVEAGRLVRMGALPVRIARTTQPIKGTRRRAVGHAVAFRLHCIRVVADVADLCQDQGSHRSFKRLWNNITDRKLYITGGIGARPGGRIRENYELPYMTSYCETCASISMSTGTTVCFITRESKYYDVLERALYNGVNSGVSLDGKRYYYDNP